MLTWLRLQSFPWLNAGGEGQSEASAMRNSANLMLLTQAAIEDNLAEKFNECPLNQGHYYCLHTIETAKTVCYME